MDWIFYLMPIGLFFLYAVGRYIVLNHEMDHAEENRLKREEQARQDRARFERELTDEAMRAGAR